MDFHCTRCGNARNGADFALLRFRLGAARSETYCVGRVCAVRDHATNWMRLGEDIPA
jgi:hypothetical protein